MADTPYLDIPGFTLRTTMPRGDVTIVTTSEPGYIETVIAGEQSKLNSRLRKRYAIPFTAPVPEVVLRWLTALVTPAVYDKRGRDPADPEMQTAQLRYDQALTELKEAADSKDGLFDLPLNEDTVQTSAIVAGGPLGCAQASPYDWVDVEAEVLNGRC